MNKNDREFLVQKIRAQYTEKQNTAGSRMDELKALDASVKRPANVFAYVYGSISALIMGCGMSLVMTDIAELIGMTSHATVVGIVVGIIGMAMAITTYPIHRGILNARKKKYGKRILELSEELIKE